MDIFLTVSVCPEPVLANPVGKSSFFHHQSMLLCTLQAVGVTTLSATPRCEKRHFLRHLYIKTNILPRQARDKHRVNSKKSGVLCRRSRARATRA